MAMSVVNLVLPVVKLDRTQNQGGAETDVSIITLPPGVLRNIGDALKITSSFSLAANANSKTNKTYFGATVVGGRTSTDNATPRMDEVWVYKRGANQQFSVGLT